MLEDFQNNKRTTYFILALSFVAGIILIFFTQNSYGGSDSVQHYQLAHWGWKYPELLFNHWGKPVFTLLISPMAQLGINSVRIFNLILGFATALLIWEIAQILKFRNSSISIFFVLITPVYFMLMFTPLTEVSFSFFLVLSTLLFFKKKYYFSAIVLSFLPLIRTEGIVILPLFILAFILKRKLLTIPLLFSGFVIISILGYQYYNDFWWLITKMPYSGNAKDIYGSGSLFHFIYNKRDPRGILGFPLSILFIIGIIVSLVRWKKNDNLKLSKGFYFLLLVPGSYIVFLFAHSYAWWQGIGNSLGLIRVIGSVTPLAALTALLGFNIIIDFAKNRNKYAAGILALSIIILVFVLSIYNYRDGFKPSGDQQVIKRATNYLKQNKLIKHKQYYFDPFVLFELGIDPYDKTKSNWNIPNAKDPSIGIPDSSIIIWDAHFGPNEGGVPLDAIQNQKSLRVLKVFTPEIPFNVLGGYNYEVHVLMKDLSLYNELITSFHYDFETNKRSNSDIYHTGTKSLHMTSSVTYAPGINAHLQEMLDTISNFRVNVSGYIFPEKATNNELPLVCALQNNKSNTYYNTYDLHNQISNVGEWNYFEHSFKINSVSSLDELLKVYIWNTHKQNFYLDDINFDIELLWDFHFDFESDKKSITGFSHTGNSCSLISPSTPYSIGQEIYIADLVDTITDFVVEVSGYIYIKKTLESELPLVCTLMEEGENLHYKTFDLRKQITRTEEWIKFEHRFKINTIKTLDEQLKIYIWNKNEQEFYLDDFEISIETSRNP